MSDIEHKDIAGLFLHIPSIRSATDPSLTDPMPAGMFWESTAFTPTRLYKRNTAMTGWDGIVSSVLAASTLTTTLLFDDNNYLDIVVSSAGLATLTATGGGGGFYFSNPTTIQGKLSLYSVTEQFRAGYDLSNYATLTVADDGTATFGGAGGLNSGYAFSRNVEFGSGTDVTLTGVTLYGAPTWDAAQAMDITGNAATATSAGGITAAEVLSVGIVNTGATIHFRETYPAGFPNTPPAGFADGQAYMAITDDLAGTADSVKLVIVMTSKGTGNHPYQLILPIPYAT